MPHSEAQRHFRILTFTTLYPNEAQPHHGVFVENRLRHLLASGEVSAHVLAPVPYFPFRSDLFGRHAAFAKAPSSEIRFGVPINHPRFLTIPKVGMSIAPYLLFASAQRALAQLIRTHHFDLIDAHYFYPDGVAAVMLGLRFNLPVVVTARGSDINLIADYAVPRRMIRWAAERADGLIAVSSALASKLSHLGIDANRITVLRNGVDGTRFRPVAPFASGKGSPPSPLAVSVGNLVPLKGHDLVIAAVAQVPELQLWIVGGGPERDNLEALAVRLGVHQRVRFLGIVPHERMSEVYSAADILVLASEREGWPNVLLEAMACGARIIATNVSDVPHIITEPAAGAWIQERTTPALVRALREVLARPASREATRQYALRYSWDATTAGQLELFGRIARYEDVGRR